MAGIFDVFTILFKSETDQATDGVKNLDRNVDDLARSVDKAGDNMADLGKKTEAAADSQRNFLDMADGLAGLAAGYLSLSTIISAFRQSVDFADQLGEFADSIGQNVEVISAWGDAAVMSGGSMQGFQASLGSLSRSMADFAAKGKSRVQPFFAELGISMTGANGQVKQAIDLLPELADSFDKLSREQSLAFGQKLGLDVGTIQLLQRGRKEIDALVARQRELGTVTQEQAEAAGAFNDSLDDTAHAFRSLYSQLLVDVQPAFSGFLKIIQDIAIFMRSHSDAVVGFSIVIGGAALAFTAASLAAIPFMATIATISGIVLAVGAVFGLVYEDIKVFMEGGDSLLGQFLDRFSGLYGTAQQVRDKVVETFEDITEAIKGMWYILTNPGEAFSTIADGISSLFSPLADSLPDLSEMFGAANRTFALTANPLGGLTSAAIGAGNMTNTSTVTVGKVEVNTQATDAEGISRDIATKLQRQLRQAAAATDNGVAY